METSAFEKDLKEILKRHGLYSPMISIDRKVEEVSFLQGSRLCSVHDELHGEITLSIKLVEPERLRESR